MAGLPNSPTEKYVYGPYIDEPIIKVGTGGTVSYHANDLYSVAALKQIPVAAGIESVMLTRLMVSSLFSRQTGVLFDQFRVMRIRTCTQDEGGTQKQNSITTGQGISIQCWGDL